MLIVIPTIVIIAITLGIVYFLHSVKGKTDSRDETRQVVEEKNVYKKEEDTNRK